MIRLLVVCTSLGLLSPWLTELAAPYSVHVAWLLDLASHWQWLHLTLLLAGIALLARRNARWLLLVPLAALPWLTVTPALPHETGTPRLELSLLTANLAQSLDASALRVLLDRQPVDLVLLQEVTPELAQQLGRWQDYPYRLLAPEDSPFGLALLSRKPLDGAKVSIDADGIPAIESRVLLPGQAIALTVVHPMPPLSPYRHQKRNMGLQVLLQKNAAHGLPGLVAGDFNASPWSQALRGVQALGWQRASDLNPSWPALGRGWLGIAIDQVVVNGPWRVAEQGLGPNLGSDHLPRLMRLQLLEKH